MSNLEHLIENGLCRLQECNSYTEWCEIMQQDVNWDGNEELFITVDTLWEICQYVIKWLRGMLKEQETMMQCIKGKCRICPHCANCDVDENGLLKEQEAVEPRVSTAEQRCGHCNKVIEMDGWQSCPWCGKRIDWESWWSKNGTRNQDS